MANKQAGLRKKLEADRFAVRSLDRHIQPLRDRGYSYRKIALYLNERDIPTANRGGHWQSSRISEIISRVAAMTTEYRERLRVEASNEDFPRKPGPDGPGLFFSESPDLLPPELAHLATVGESAEPAEVRRLLGIGAEFWAEYQRALSAIDRRLDYPIEKLGGVCRTEWERMMTDCLEAQSLRMSGMLEEALSIINRWLQRSASNPFAQADLFRRKSVPLWQLGLRDEAVEVAKLAAWLYKNLGLSGYDPDGCGLGNSLFALGQAQYINGDVPSSVESFRESLRHVNVADIPDLHGYALAGLAVALAAIGTDEALVEARVGLAEVRAKFFRKGANRCTFHMARLDWLEGSIIWRTAERNRYRGREMVRRGRDLLTELNVPLDAACCAADLELMWRPQHRGAALKDLAGWLNKAYAILPQDLASSFETLIKELGRPNYFGWSDFRKAVREIRSTAEEGASVLPGFV